MKPWSRRLEALEAAVADLGVGADLCPACAPPVHVAVLTLEYGEEIPRCPSCGERTDRSGRRAIGQIVVIDLGAEKRAEIARAKREAEAVEAKERPGRSGEGPAA